MDLLRAGLLLLVIFLPLSISLWFNLKMLKQNQENNARLIEAIREAKGT